MLNVWLAYIEPHLNTRLNTMQRSVVGLQISINDKAVGELLIQLYDDICPRTTRNFLLLSKGGQLSKDDGKSLGYRDSCFHRLVHDGFIQGGGMYVFMN
jgi:hypothetical protein